MKLLRKSINVILVLSTVFLSIMTFLPTVYASVQGTITGNEVRFRSAPTTNSTTYDFLYNGNIVTVTSTSKISGAGCSDGWYSVDYGGRSGYVCSSYVALAGESYEASYGRPWTTPKKAIMGGASFIAGDYIAKGQNTSYLKKFNVNPNSSWGQNTHQYMANLAAPYNEAATTYESYQENGLLSLPLHFIIPVYNNMPSKTSHPKYGEEQGGTSTVTDRAFEDELNAQGFDETYKVWLRALHNEYPNWTFEALHTNLDFNSTVNIQQQIGSIQKWNCSQCVQTPEVETESGWYIANKQTVEYFLDPRNFLMADSVLMFEDLAYNEVYKEETVKSVLAGTFMSGNDNVDNVSYSSMFMEAGKTYNVNPVYLASLSRQEVGTTKGLVTSGEQFEYKGITYVGFYNFYNIGAYSSEENPAKAGLVFASAGSTPNSDGIYVGNIDSGGGSSGDNSNNNNSGNNNNNNGNNGNTNTPNATPVATHLSNMRLNRKGSYITNLQVGTTVSNLKSKTNGNELTFKNASGATLGDSEKLTTGSTITFSTGETYTIVIYGDLTGDGDIDSADLLRMRQQLLGKVSLNGSYLEAAHVYNTSGDVDSSDLLRLRQHLLGKTSINQA